MIEDSDDFKKMHKSLKGLIDGKKCEKLSVSLLKNFLKNDVSKHYAMKIFLLDEKLPVISPIKMNQAYEELQKIVVPENCQENHTGLINDFTSKTVA
jgi:FixJ family two-component response regulator